MKEYLNQNKGLINSAIAGAVATVAGLSWLSVLKSKNKDKAKMKIELLEKEQELENTIAIHKSEIDEKSHQLELFENQLKRLKEAISEIK